MQFKNVGYIALGVGLILLVPFVAMQFTQDVNWSLGDFVVMGILLFGTGILLELARTKITRPSHRIAASLAIVFALFVVWAELAVDAVSQTVAFIAR